METAVYAFTGLLESGKTTLIYEVVKEEGFLEPGDTVLVQCEEGEAKLEEAFLAGHSITTVAVEKPEELNAELWKRIEKEYAPMQVMIEYNGMWESEKLFDCGMPEDWYIGGIYTTVNAETAELYLTNMRKTFMEPLKASNLVIINRCDEDIDKIRFRRTIKGLNPQCQLAFESRDGEMMENAEDEMPFDYSGDVVMIDDMDYGLWYVDAIEHPSRYMGKEIEFTAKHCASMEEGMNYFVPGRHVMTCCEDDIQFLGFICYFKDGMTSGFSHGDWCRVRVSFDFGQHEMYGYDDGPILELLSIEAAQKPEQELVTFS